MQRRFFSEQGERAWSEGIVPHYITSNTVMARAYAKLTYAYLRDLHDAGMRFVDSSAPLHIIELGAGAGRFSFHFLRKFFSLLEHSGLKDAKVCYVMTDFAESNIAFWQSHPALQEFVADGRLDFACFDAESSGQLLLRNAGITLAPDGTTTPCVVVANYVFDSISHDAFQVREGAIHEMLVTCGEEAAGAGGEQNAVGVLDGLRVDFHSMSKPIDCDNYYADARFNRTLQRHAGDDGDLLFPIAALTTIRNLYRISGGHMLLLSADKGYGSLEHAAECDVLGIARHGSVSMMVNYHAISLYVEALHGAFLALPQQHNSLEMCAALFGDVPGRHVETRHAFQESVVECGPDDFCTLKRVFANHATNLDFRQIIAYLRMSGWDSQHFFDCYQALLTHVDVCEARDKREIPGLCAHVRKNHYDLASEIDLDYCLAQLLYRAGFYREAASFLQHSLEHHPDAADSLYNLAACHYNLGEMAQALACAKQCLGVAPDFVAAQEMLVEAMGADVAHL